MISPTPTALLALALLTAAGRAQETPPSHPPTPPPAEAGQGAGQPGQQPGQQQEQQEPETPRTPRGRGRRGQGPGGRGDEPFELPAFEPVAAPPLSGLQQKQYFWFCLYPDRVVQYDPDTDAVTAEVKLANGMFWNETLTHDRKRLLVVTDQQRTIEVVDLASKSLLGTHSFQEDGYILRIRSVREMPGGVLWFVQTDRVKKELDRYSFEAAKWLLYDSAQKKTVRRFDRLPEALERNTRISADGTHWLSQDREGDLVFLGGRKLEELGRIDLHTPRFFGAGPIRLMGTDLLDGRDPKRALMLFTSTDPVEDERTGWGLVELDLENKRIGEVREWGPQVSAWGLRVATKKPVGALMSGSFGGRRDGDNRSRLMVYELETGRRTAEAEFEFRPRRSLSAISPDGDKIYVGGAGSDFEVFDADLKRLKTVELDGEIWGRVFTIDA